MKLQLNCFNRASIWRGDLRADLKALWEKVLKLLQGYFLVLKFGFILKDELFLISFFVSYKPVLESCTFSALYCFLSRIFFHS